jgi:hypothetical protein
MKSVIQRIRQKDDSQKIIKSLLVTPTVLDELFDTILHDETSLKYGCEKIVRAISETKPELIYPYFDHFVALLDYNNNFLKWGTIITIANLCVADKENKFEAIFNKYYGFINGKDMVAAANVIGNSWKIALAKSQLIPFITEKILAVQKARYEHKGKLSSECRNVVIGVAIDSFAKFYDKIEEKETVINFVKKQQKNSRPQVVKKAQSFLKKLAVK